MMSVCDYAGHTTFLYILMYRETKESNLRLLLHLDPVWFVFLAASFYIYTVVGEWLKPGPC